MKINVKISNFKLGFSVVLSALLSKLDLFSKRTYLYLINNPLTGMEIIYWILVIILVIVVTHLLDIKF